MCLPKFRTSQIIFVQIIIILLTLLSIFLTSGALNVQLRVFGLVIFDFLCLIFILSSNWHFSNFNHNKLLVFLVAIFTFIVFFILAILANSQTADINYNDKIIPYFWLYLTIIAVLVIESFLWFFNGTFYSFQKISFYLHNRSDIKNKKLQEDNLEKLKTFSQILTTYEGIINMDTLASLLDKKNSIQLQKWLLTNNLKGYVIKDGTFTVTSSSDLSVSIDELLNSFSMVKINQ